MKIRKFIILAVVAVMLFSAFSVTASAKEIQSDNGIEQQEINIARGPTSTVTVVGSKIKWDLGPYSNSFVTMLVTDVTDTNVTPFVYNASNQPTGEYIYSFVSGHSYTVKLIITGTSTEIASCTHRHP